MSAGLLYQPFKLLLTVVCIWFHLLNHGANGLNLGISLTMRLIAATIDCNT